MTFPELSLDLMPQELKEPVQLWSHKKPYPSGKTYGTLLFYCDDRKFNAIRNNVSLLLRENFHQMAELNISTFDTDDEQIVTYQTFEKRRISFIAQSRGIPIWVDLNVLPQFQKINLLGVPKGWTSYITRANRKNYAELFKEYQIACNHCGDASKVKFVVYGGDTKTLQICKDFGWTWIQQQTPKHGLGKM